MSCHSYTVDRCGIYIVCTCILATLLAHVLLYLSHETHTHAHTHTHIHTYSHTHRTCFYALCLISKTTQGASLLLEEGWTTVQHSAEEKWPLIFEHNLEKDDTPFLSPSSFSQTKRFKFPLFSESSSDSLQSPQSPKSMISPFPHKNLTLPAKVATSKSYAGSLDLMHSKSGDKCGDPKQKLIKTESSGQIIEQEQPFQMAMKFRRIHSVSRKGSSKFRFTSSKKRTMYHAFEVQRRRSQRKKGVDSSEGRPKSVSVADMLDSPELRTTS